MKHLFFNFLLSTFLVSCSSPHIKSIKDKWGLKAGPPSEVEIASGLKEALKVGSTHAAEILSKKGGYLDNPKVKIPLPPEAKKLESTLRSMGMSTIVDQAIASINQAAEAAAPQAKAIFLTTVQSMTVQDALTILKGKNDEATQYLKRTSSDSLTKAFEPVIKSSLEKVDATKYWSKVLKEYNRIPLVTKINPDLASFVTQKSLDGLFLYVSEEEQKIRENPLARASHLLKRVFGYGDELRG